MEKNPKPIDTISLMADLVGFFKSAAIVLGMTVIEWARAKQAQAEDRQAVAESELASEKAKNAVEKDYSDRLAPDIIREYLDSRGPGEPGA